MGLQNDMSIGGPKGWHDKTIGLLTERKNKNFLSPCPIFRTSTWHYTNAKDDGR